MEKFINLITMNKACTPKKPKQTLKRRESRDKKITEVMNFCVLPQRSTWDDYYIHVYGSKDLESIANVVSNRCRYKVGDYLICSYKATTNKIGTNKFTIIDSIEYNVVNVAEFNTYGFLPFQRILMYNRIDRSNRLVLVQAPKD